MLQVMTHCSQQKVLSNFFLILKNIKSEDNAKTLKQKVLHLVSSVSLISTMKSSQFNQLWGLANIKTLIWMTELVGIYYTKGQYY